MSFSASLGSQATTIVPVFKVPIPNQKRREEHTDNCNVRRSFPLYRRCTQGLAWRTTVPSLSSPKCPRWFCFHSVPGALWVSPKPKETQTFPKNFVEEMEEVEEELTSGSQREEVTLLTGCFPSPFLATRPPWFFSLVRPTTAVVFFPPFVFFFCSLFSSFFHFSLSKAIVVAFHCLASSIKNFSGILTQLRKVHEVELQGLLNTPKVTRGTSTWEKWERSTPTQPLPLPSSNPLDSYNVDPPLAF